MTLSKRRLQFLDQLVEMYQEQGFPVHYEALAKAIGVSKWTAYDMLKEIEKSGYIKRSYEVNSKETGRSQVVFTPTEKATGLFMHQRSTAASHENWEESLQSIQEMLTIMKHTSMQDLMTKLLDEIPQGRTNLEFCGYILGILIVYLKKVGGPTEFFIQRLINRTSNHHSSLMIFVGSVLGTIIQTMNDELSSEVVELVSEYVMMIGNLTNEEQRLLFDFVNEALV